MLKIMITGAGGQVGAELLRQAEGAFHTYPFDSKTLDIRDRNAVASAIGCINPSVVINASAYTAVDQAEAEPQEALRVNASGAENLAYACAASGARLVHLSTDFVFDGQSPTPYEPNAKTNPLNTYGVSKWQGEIYVKRQLPTASLIIRTAWVWSLNSNNFTNTITRKLLSNSDVEVVSDQFGTPTYAPDLARAILKLCNHDPAYERGILHYTNAGSCSWFDFASSIRLSLSRMYPQPQLGEVIPIPTSRFPCKATRPKFSVLNCYAAWEMAGRPVHWQIPLFDDAFREWASQLTS